MRGKLVFGNIRYQIRVAMVVCGNGTEVMVFPPWCSDPEKLHDPLRAFVVHFQMERHFVLPVGRVVHKGIDNALDECVIFHGLHRMAIDILPGDPEGICPNGFNGSVGNELNFFSLNSSSTSLLLTTV